MPDAESYLRSIDEGLHHVHDAIEDLRRSNGSQLEQIQRSLDALLVEVRKLRGQSAA